MSLSGEKRASALASLVVRRLAATATFVTLCGCPAAAPPPIGPHSWDPERGWSATVDRDTAGGAAAQGAGSLGAAASAELIAEGKRAPWELRDKLAELTPIAGRGPSEHLGGRFERTVRVNDAAKSYGQLAASGPIPDGALIVQQHHVPGSDAVYGTFVMLRRGGDEPSWELTVVDARGRVAARGALRSCLRCHQEAPHDGLFGPATMK